VSGAPAPVIYLAGPDVFLPDAHGMGALKKDLCARHGLKGVYPLEAELSLEGDTAMSRAIFDANVATIRRCDAVVANLTPFRGPSADAGTVFEVGAAFALGKPVFGYANVVGDYRARVEEAYGALETCDGRHFAADGMNVEDFGLPDNLMIVEAIRAQGWEMVTRATPHAALYTDLVAFELCLRQAVAVLLGRS
jgi:nucleoside 2-deoxyribosyltransferase